MKRTRYFNFKKPEPYDTRNINDFNDSFDLVDTVLKQTQDTNKHLDETFKQLIIDAGDNNGEIVAARRDRVANKTYDSVPDRLDDVSSQLRQKASQVNVKEFGAIGDGIANDTVAVQNAINYALINEIEEVFFPDGTYLISQIEIRNSLKLTCGFNAWLKRIGQNSMILVDYLSDESTNVSNIDSSLNNITQITVANIGNIKRGSVVKVCSDDLVQEMQYNYKRGEFKVVYDVNTNNNTIKLMGKLRYTYSTNIKLVLCTEKKFKSETLNLTSSDEIIGESTVALLYIMGGKGHKISNVKIHDCAETGIKLAGCYGYEINGFYSDYQENGETYDLSGKIGYGILDIAGGYYSIGFKTNNLRHSFTANGTSTEIGLEVCGVSEYGKIDNSLSQGGSYSGICVHEGSYGVTFNNCICTDAYGYAATLRGNDIKIKNSDVLGTHGINIGNYKNSNGQQMTSYKGHYIVENCDIETVRTAIFSNGNGVEISSKFKNCFIKGNDLTITDSDIEFDNCDIDLSVITVTNSVLRFTNCRIKIAAISLVNNCTLYVNGGTIYPTASYCYNHTGIGEQKIYWTNVTLDYSKTSSTNSNRGISFMTSQNFPNLNISLNMVGTVVYLDTSSQRTFYLFYNGFNPAIMTIQCFGLFVFPDGVNLFTPITTWSNTNIVQLKNLTYAFGSMEQITS